MPTPFELRAELLAWALRLPGAYEDHPWGESVAKVDKKVFVFFGGAADENGQRCGLAVKLPTSMLDALAIPGAAPTGYGLGRSGWVSLDLRAFGDFDQLTRWIEESFRAVAKRSRTKELDAARAT